MEEVADLRLEVLYFRHRKLLIEDGKGSKDCIVYLSHDAHQALADYLRVQPFCRSRRVFFVERDRLPSSPCRSAAFRNT